MLFRSVNTSGTYKFSISGNALTATTANALASNGINCAAGEYPLGVDPDADVESCTDATTEIVSIDTATNNSMKAYVDAQVANTGGNSTAEIRADRKSVV